MNVKRYRELKNGVGNKIKDAIEAMQKSEELTSYNFNGVMLYSDVDDLDSAYKKITGKSYEEFNAAIDEEIERRKKEREEHEKAIPKLTEEWVEKGRQILEAKYMKNWERCVPIRLNDLYDGMELGACLEIVKELNAGCMLDYARSLINAQGHSGVSYGLVLSMIRSFCSRGEEFAKYVRESF